MSPRLRISRKIDPFNPAYKVDVSFVNTPPLRKVDKSKLFATISNSGSGGEEPRVPPLHISLRGRNASVVQIRKKEKKLKEGDDETTLKRRGKLKKIKEDGHKLVQKKSLNMIIGTNNIPIVNSTLTQQQQQHNNAINCKINNTVAIKANTVATCNLEGSGNKSGNIKPSSSKSGDVDDIPLNSRIPSPLKHKIGVLNQTTNSTLMKNQVESDVQNHTNEHKIGGGKISLNVSGLVLFFFSLFKTLFSKAEFNFPSFGFVSLNP